VREDVFDKGTLSRLDASEELSFAAKIGRTYGSQMELDLKSPTLDVLFGICDALDVTASTVIAPVEATREKTRKDVLTFGACLPLN
jgi:transcriptional regulator with XRE-family HTH domain